VIEFRHPREEERPEVADLMRIAFNPPPERARALESELVLEGFLAAYEQGNLAAIAKAHRMEQWFGGRPVPMSGIAAVAAVPERRGGRIASQTVAELLRREKTRGAVITSLYPSRSDVYRRLGYEYSGARTRWKVPLSALRADGDAPVERMTAADRPAVDACYRAFAATQSGPIACDEQSWWSQRIARESAGLTTRSVVVRGAGGAGVEGYAVFQIEPGTSHLGFGYRIACTHLVFLTQRAGASLLNYFRRYRGIGTELIWYGAPNDPVALLMETGADTLAPVSILRFMTRLLDVPGAFAARGWPPVSGSAEIAVADPLFQENDGLFRLIAKDGVVRAEKAGPRAGAAMSINALSALWSGGLSAGDLERLGGLPAGGGARALLAALCPPEPCWMFEMF